MQRLISERTQWDQTRAPPDSEVPALRLHAAHWSLGENEIGCPVRCSAISMPPGKGPAGIAGGPGGQTRAASRPSARDRNRACGCRCRLRCRLTLTFKLCRRAARYTIWRYNSAAAQADGGASRNHQISIDDASDTPAEDGEPRNGSPIGRARARVGLSPCRARPGGA